MGCAMSDAADDPGERLSKRVAALGRCSRKDAEAWIAGGWVTVDGEVANDPARRIRNELVHIDPAGSAQARGPQSWLWHKPAGVPLALEQTLAADPAAHPWMTPWQSRHGRCATPMPARASGLAVFTLQPAMRRLLDDPDRPLEHEWMIDVPGPLPQDAIPILTGTGKRLAHGPRSPEIKLSVSSQNTERTRLRLAILRYDPQQLGAWLKAANVPFTLLHRLRIGRLTLGHVALGHSRPVGDHERF